MRTITETNKDLDIEAIVRAVHVLAPVANISPEAIEEAAEVVEAMAKAGRFDADEGE